MRGNISFSEAHIEQDIVHQIFDYYSQPSKASLIKLQKVRILFMNKRVISPKSFSTYNAIHWALTSRNAIHVCGNDKDVEYKGNICVRKFLVLHQNKPY